MDWYEASAELEAMRLFWKEMGFDEGKVDYSCNTDGRAMLENNKLGQLMEMKMKKEPLEKVYEQMKRYCKALNAKALPLPKFGIYVVAHSQEYTIFNLDKDLDNVTDAIMISGFAKIGTAASQERELFYRWLKDDSVLPGWINEGSVVAYNDLYYKLRGNSKKSKDAFIAELQNPMQLNIEPYAWNNGGDLEMKLLDCLGSEGLKKRLGAFYTPDYAAKISTDYVRNIIAKLQPDEDYLIVDRCAGTGQLEQFFDDEELKHCVLNTIVYAERKVLDELYGGRVKAILPGSFTLDTEGLLPEGDALEEPFNKYLKKFIESERTNAKANGKKLVVIGLENPPYGEPQAEATRSGNTRKGSNKNYVTIKMKEVVSGPAVNELVNKFIWSGFKWYFDYYTLYSPIKYWKSQHLISKHCLEGIFVNRKDFHASPGAISIISWVNKDSTYDALNLSGVLVKRIDKGVTTLLKYNKQDNNHDLCYEIICGTPDMKHGYITNDRSFSMVKAKRGGYLNVNDPLMKQILPLFTANCYTPKDWTEIDVIMKSGDGGTKYMQDQEFLEDCFIWCCMTNQNKCKSDPSQNLKNEMALLQNTKADKIVNIKGYRKGLMDAWKTVLGESKICSEYDPRKTYGLDQIEKELNIDIPTNTVTKTGKQNMEKKYPDLDNKIKEFKVKLKEFYKDHIEPKLFQYELLK